MVVPAAGSGSRFAHAEPKQYAVLRGATVLEHALAPFLNAPAGDEECCGLVLALAAGDARFAALPAARDPRVTTTPGGDTRAASVLAGLAEVERRGGAAADWVLVHDAARPCLSSAELRALLAALRTPAGAAQGALLGLPVTDTVKRAAAVEALPQAVATVPRDGLWRALTPQAFPLGLLQQALGAALARSARGAAEPPTDEASAVEACGRTPVLVPGSPYNVKITLPADLAFAAAVLRAREEESTDAA